MSGRDSKNSVIYFFLRLGVVIFLAGVFWQLAQKPGFETEIWNDITQIFASIVYTLLVIVVLAAPKHNFNILGFFFTAVGSFALLLKNMLVQGVYINLPTYFFIIIVSFYFMTKGGERHSRHNNYF